MKTFPLSAYLRTLRQYWRDPKGHHDIVDFAAAAVVIAAATLAVIVGYEWLWIR